MDKMKAARSTLSNLTVQDELEIQRLMSVYAVCDDTGDAEGWADLFTADGTFVGLGKKPVIGREALIAFAKRRWAEEPQARRRAHWLSNIIITATPEGAEAYSYQMTIDKQADGGIRIFKLTGKSDELRRVNGQWRFFVRRTVEVTAE